MLCLQDKKNCEMWNPKWTQCYFRGTVLVNILRITIPKSQSCKSFWLFTHRTNFLSSYLFIIQFFILVFNVINLFLRTQNTFFWVGSLVSYTEPSNHQLYLFCFLSGQFLHQWQNVSGQQFRCQSYKTQNPIKLD